MKKRRHQLGSESPGDSSAIRKARKRPKLRKTRDTYALNAAKMIDAAFARKTLITIGNQTSEVSTFRAIVLQLAIKAATNRRALRVLSRYKAYAEKRRGLDEPLIVFARPAGSNP